MSKIHPTSGNKGHTLLLKEEEEGMLTVWKRSSMSFKGTDGFTVFNKQGRLVFRVDNYSRNTPCVSAGGLLLMDGAGNALLSLKPQILSMQYQWNGYREEGGCGKRGIGIGMTKVFTMRSSSLLFRKDEAEVFMMGSRKADFKIEGCFTTRNCNIRTGNGEMVAKICRKRANSNSTIMLSDDVFSLLVHPGFGTDLIMAFVVILDRISSNPYTPVFCS